MKGKKFACRTPEMVGILKKVEVSLRQIKLKDFVCFSLRKKNGINLHCQYLSRGADM